MTFLRATLATLVCAACSGPAGPPDLEPAMRIYVAGEGDSSLHVYDLETFEEVATLPMPQGPTEVHATPDGRTVWVVGTGGATVALVDTETLTVRNVPVGAAPVHSYVEPGYARVWVGNDGSGDVSVIDLASGTATRTLTGSGHHKLALATDGSGALRFAYVSNISDGTISVLDPSATLVTNVSVGPAPHGMDYAAGTGLVYNCSGDAENSIEVLDPDAPTPHSVVDRIPLPSRCGAIRVEPDGVTAFATLGDEDLLARIDLATRAVETFDAGAGPDKWAIVGGRAFVANVDAATVTVVDLGNGATRSIAVGQVHAHGGHAHRGLRLFRNLVLVPNAHDNTVSVIDVDSEAVIATLDGVVEPSGIAIAGPEGGTTYPR